MEEWLKECETNVHDNNCKMISSHEFSSTHCFKECMTLSILITFECAAYMESSVSSVLIFFISKVLFEVGCCWSPYLDHQWEPEGKESEFCVPSSSSPSESCVNTKSTISSFVSHTSTTWACASHPSLKNPWVGSGCWYKPEPISLVGIVPFTYRALNCSNISTFHLHQWFCFFPSKSLIKFFVQYFLIISLIEVTPILYFKFK